MPTTITVSRTIALLLAIGHALIGLGMGWNIGPVHYDPGALLVRGSAGSFEAGLERLFPRLVGCLYVSLAMGLVYGVMGSRSNATASTALRTSLVPCLCYHLGAFTDAVNLFREDAGAINVDKMNPMEPAYGHGLFLTLCILAFVTTGVVESGGSTIKRE